MTQPSYPVRTDRSRALAERMSAGMQERVLSFPLTAFTADGARIAEEPFRAHLSSRVAGDAAAVFIACGTGEFGALSEDEFRTAIGVAVDEVSDAVPVVAGVGYGWAQAQRFAAIAEEAGADAALVMPHYLVSAPQAGLAAHVRRISASTDLPLIIYQRGQADYAPETVRELSHLPNVVGLKDGRSNYPALQMTTLAVDDEFLFFNGALTAELQYRPYASIGITAYSSAVHAFVPEVANAFFRAARAGDDDTMDALLRTFYGPLVELRDEVRGYAVALVKAGARLRGQNVGPVRAPLSDPHDAHIRRLDEITRAGLALIGEEF
ncbi:5-dehydro-4-deoxyglucarate dehydratase [Microbacterium pseudoresistens]|uniref:5-dehydro-4-deoxyglucarate dehydratase n=1 Tax=Microbacterium pseudoresistens TaxID=640634 RepID=A0A7Y9JLU2_9MICO|nr:5-dehydro-4-deoxyglucarate dehydratase [Microbacterium pseudoresistens]NYD53301.1 5-dehydro-4-deoxyglucarate dehydratase [Microbacterium pseudoresistens]